MAGMESSSGARPKRTPRLRRLFAIFGVGLLAFLTALLLFLHTPPARRFVVSQVTRLLQQQHIQFTTDGLDYNLFSLRLALRNVRVRSQDAPDLPPFAHIDRLSADLSLTQLLRRRYVVQSGEADGVTVHYVVDAQGRDNLPRPPHDPEQPSRPLDYLIEELHVTNANVHYEQRAQRIDVVLPISSIELEGNALTDRHTVRLAAGKGTMVVQERKALLDAIDGELEFGEDDVRFEQLEVLVDGARVTLSGTIAQFADPHADLNVRGSADATRVSALVNLADPVGGGVEIEASIKGRLSSPAIEGRVKGTNVSFRNLSDLQVETTAAYDMGQQRVTIADLRVRAPFGEVAGHGSVELAGHDPSKLTATITGLDLAALMRAFEAPYVVASRVDAQVQAEWPGLEIPPGIGERDRRAYRDHISRLALDHPTWRARLRDWTRQLNRRTDALNCGAGRECQRPRSRCQPRASRRPGAGPDLPMWRAPSQPPRGCWLALPEVCCPLLWPESSRARCRSAAP